jgi:hypothetical protein
LTSFFYPVIFKGKELARGAFRTLFLGVLPSVVREALFYCYKLRLTRHVELRIIKKEGYPWPLSDVGFGDFASNVLGTLFYIAKNADTGVFLSYSNIRLFSFKDTVDLQQPPLRRL